MGKVDEGRKIARRALDLAISLDLHRGMLHYDLARAYAVPDQRGQTSIRSAASQLFRAFVANPLYRERYTQDSAFDKVRVRLDAVLGTKFDPGEEYRRRLAAMSSAKAPCSAVS